MNLSYTKNLLTEIGIFFVINGKEINETISVEWEKY